MIGVISVDSFKLRIPISEVEIVDERIFGTKYVINAFGEWESQFEQKRYKHEYEGVTFSLGLETQVTAEQRTKDYLVMKITSKLLHEGYLDGITGANKRIVYDRIMSYRLVSFSFASFCEGSCTDVDFKKDLINSDFDNTVNVLSTHARLSKKINEGCNSFRSKSNKGIEFGKRERASKSYPFLKFYHKALELMNRSYVFYLMYVKPNLSDDFDFENLVRVETTVKNKAHFRSLEVHDTSLDGVLSLDQSKLESIMKKALSIHLEPRIVTIKDNNDLKPSDKAYYNFIYAMMRNGSSYHMICEIGLQNMSSREKRRIRSKFDQIYDSLIRDTSEDHTTKKLDKFFNAVGWA